MKETEWARKITKILTSTLQKGDAALEASDGQRLTYANEIRSYNQESPVLHSMKYETDILIWEQLDADQWLPRVVIETKIGGITTHDAITYSQKAQTHKQVHPYLRYGILAGNMGHTALPGRLIRHGAHFDFMMVHQGFEPSKKEWSSLIEILQSEIQASRMLERQIFESRTKNRDKHFMLHKPLVMN